MAVERRRNKRTQMKSKLIIKRLDKKENDEILISVTDVSRTGIGFVCDKPFTIGAVYEAFLTIWTKEVIHAFLQIVRIEMNEDNGFNYGAVFVGMPEMEASRIDVYQAFNDND